MGACVRARVRARNLRALFTRLLTLASHWSDYFCPDARPPHGLRFYCERGFGDRVCSYPKILRNPTEFVPCSFYHSLRLTQLELVRSARIGQGPHETSQRDQSDSPPRRPDVGGVGCDDDDDDGFAQPPSAPHPTPLPVTSDALNADTDEVELAKSLAAIPNLVERRRPTPLSPSSSINAYDQASEAHRNPPFPPARRRQTPSDRCVSFSSTALVQVGSDGGGGGSSSPSGSSGANSLKTSAGIATGPEQAQSLHSNQLASAPWYQPNIPRDLALDMLARQPPGSFIVRDSGTHSNCYALSVRVGSDSSQSHATERCLSAGMTPRTSAGGGGGAGGAISHYLIQRTPTGVRLKGLEKEWPSLPCLILHLTVMPEMLPCPLLGLPQSSSNPSAFLSGHQHHPHFEQAPDSCSFRPISTGADPRPATPLPANSEYQQLSEFSSILADLDNHDRRRRQRRQPPPPPPARIR
ncbi:unnamed protein product [Mesocestoides corti]|uniref:SH2 domain-containing protein n=1 Tax=Mesocestoides corti TaxID=53468 RepID=A0A0R3UEQ0_MESCO|nr:unnamed protein product [Mesocestoides corti]